MNKLIPLVFIAMLISIVLNIDTLTIILSLVLMVGCITHLASFKDT